jgi:alpha-aminoadipic semialdehyde synthase
MRYAPGERDMVVLAHELVTASEVHRSTLIAYGDEQGSAMAKTVGMPVAFAALKVLDGEVTGRGVMGPTEASVYDGVLDGMEEAGLGMQESVGKIEGTVEGVLDGWLRDNEKMLARG